MERYSFSPVSRALVITEKFHDKMQDMESDEFKLYTKLMTAVPDLQVIRRTHRTPRQYTAQNGKTYQCNPFKNLTYVNMERFIRSLKNSEDYMREYLYLKDCASCIQTNHYTIVRKWFIAQFPDARENPLEYLGHSPAVISGKQFLEELSATPAA